MSSTNSVNPWSAAKRLLCYKPAQPVQSTPAVLPGLPTPAAPPSPLDALEAPQRSVAPRTRATWLDRASQGAGSGWTFLAMMSLVGAWAVAGVPMGASNTWQIIMEDFSSIQCYLWDITLLNTQRRDTAELAARLTDWQASNRDKLARLRHVLAEQLPVLPLPSNPDEVRVTVEDAAPIVPRRSRYDAAADRASEIAGSTLAQAVYIAGLIAWLGVGPSRQFNNTWQLDVNTAVAVELTIMTTFLQNTKRRHRQSTARTSDGIETADALLENRLRLSAPHVEVPAAPAVPERTRTRWQKIKDGGARAVEGYAHFMGSTGGVLLSAGAFATWIGLGKKLGYNNSNWWLIIGTYTGLVGFVDGFVLRNVQARASVALEEQFAALQASDEELLQLLHIPAPPPSEPEPVTWYQRFSTGLARMAAHPAALACSIATVVGLLGTATGMRWSQTAQLICNTPTMIIEGDLLLTLMDGHMIAHRRSQARLENAIQRRQLIDAALDLLVAPSA